MAAKRLTPQRVSGPASKHTGYKNVGTERATPKDEMRQLLKGHVDLNNLGDGKASS